MFRVSTLDMANLSAPSKRPRAYDFSRDFFGKEAFLTVSGQLNVETYCLALLEGLHVRADVPRREQQHQPPPRRVLDGRAEIAFADLAADADLAESFLKYILTRF
jgi:asparaginyl-tRNA synthetase